MSAALSHAMKNLRKVHLSQGLALVVSRPVKLQAGFVFELPETTIQTVPVVTPLCFRNVTSGWRANFAVPTLPDTDQPMFAKFVVAPLASTMRTDDPTIWRMSRPGVWIEIVTGLPLDDRLRSFGLKSTIAL